jgi:carboxyl-terminal processing protease
MKFLKLALYFLGLVLLICAGFAAGYVFRTQDPASSEYPLLAESRRLLEEYGLKPLPSPPAVEYGMIRGMLQSYDDPYTVFVEPPQNELQGNQLQGSYGGIGAQVEKDPGGFWAIYPFPEGPARDAGIQDGDRLLKVEGAAILADMPADTITAKLRGPVDRAVLLELGRAPQYTPFSVSVTRKEIPLPSVTWRLAPQEPRLGLVKVNLIAASTPGEIQKAIQDLQSRGATHFALDLRDNPGGLLTAGVDVARLFLKDGMVMQQQYRDKDVETYRVEKPGPDAALPLVVLINHGSASAAEIAAGALQANQRAPLIGAASYGKDTVQLLFTLTDGSSLHVTAAHWWVPGQQGSLQGHGLQPDIQVDPASDPTAADPFIQAAIHYFFKS